MSHPRFPVATLPTTKTLQQLIADGYVSSHTKTKVSELTEEERFAICWLAGVPIERQEYKDGKVTYVLRACGMTFVGDHWSVYFNLPGSRGSMKGGDA